MICPLCSHDMIEFHHPQTHHLFHVCPSCEAIIKNHENCSNPTDEKKRYEAHQNDLDQEGYVTFLSAFIERAICPFDVHDLLDYGCGPSPILGTLLHQLGYHVDLFDPFFYPKEPLHTYDMVVSTEVVEHFKDPIHSFHHIDDLVKPHGYVAIMTLFHPNDRDQFFNWFYIRDFTHVIFYTLKTLDMMMSTMGYERVYSDQKRIAVFHKK